MRGYRVLTGLCIIAVALLLAYAWYDGGREPVGRIVVPVAVPEIAR